MRDMNSCILLRRLLLYFNFVYCEWGMFLLRGLTLRGENQLMQICKAGHIFKHVEDDARMQTLLLCICNTSQLNNAILDDSSACCSVLYNIRQIIRLQVHGLRNAHGGQAPVRNSVLGLS